jgi:23S rRNA (uracil1939-C5)-methyltransferase
MTNSVTQLRKGQEVDLTVESVAFGGQGVARLDGLVVFVDGATTGDRVRASLRKIKKSFAEARVVDILTPSTDRVTAPCPHFGLCGGCKMQHLRYEAQLEIKRQNVAEVFERIGIFPSLDVPQPLASPRLFAYRNKMEFTFSDRPWRLRDEIDQNTAFALGFHLPQRYDKVLDVRECHLTSPVVNRLLQFVKSFATESGRPPYSVKTHEGYWRFLVVRETAHTSQLMVNIITSRHDRDMQERMRKEIPAAIPEITNLINGITSRKSHVAVSDEEVLLAGHPVIEESLGDYRFEISSNSFFQTNSHAAEILYRTALEMAELTGNEIVYDLYSGTGSLALYVSRYARRVIGVEVVDAAVQNAIRNAAHNGATNCKFYSGDLKDIILTLRETPDVVILDPPRSGIHPEVARALLDIRPRRMIYVSCNPATQARDLAILCREHYALDRVQPVDMFPHTYHIENVARIRLRP